MFKKCGKVRVLRDIDLTPYTVLKAGETGTIANVYDDAEGIWAVDVMPDKQHLGLAQWNFEAHIAFEDLEALDPVASLRPYGRLVATIAALLGWVLGVLEGGTWWTAS